MSSSSSNAYVSPDAMLTGVGTAAPQTRTSSTALRYPQIVRFSRATASGSGISPTRLPVAGSSRRHVFPYAT
jgi:hypothetical protein